MRKFIATNSSLSEQGVLGFEYGYSIANPNTLTLWEAQFGDFANGAQSVIDQYVTCAETKWNLPSGLVMLLPHGYDGQGPEHSSARVERYLQMCDDDPDVIPDFEADYFDKNQRNYNWSVVNCSTAANYFHVLRRQLRRDFRKPLVVVAPKKLLKFRDASSKIESFGPGHKFSRTISERDSDSLLPKDKIRKIIFCTGQVYYDIRNERNQKGQKDAVIISVEQIFPLPYDHIARHIKNYPNIEEVVWAQEEHKNMGAWSFIQPRVNNLMKKIGADMEVVYAGRPASAATATGFPKVHKEELANLLETALK